MATVKKANITKEQMLADGWKEMEDKVFILEKEIENRNPLNNDPEDTDIKLKIMNKNLNSVPSAGTEAETSATADVTTSRQPIANTFVGSSTFKQRDRKFRAWNHTVKRMQYFTLEEVENQKSSIQWHILTITELIGNNGEIDIYEGDIDSRNYLIKWSDKHSLFCQHYFQSYLNKWVEASYPIDLRDIKIKGNIFQNPELLG